MAPGQSPVEYAELGTSEYLFFTVTGTTDHCVGGGCGLAGADGDLLEGPTAHGAGAENGLSDIVAPMDSLIAVFLGPDDPSLSGAPAALDFGSAASRDFHLLRPGLKQVFFIGDGLGADGFPQVFAVPEGATRLFLGTMDSFGWYNNVGSLSVTVGAVDVDFVPEPMSLTLFGVAALAGFGRRLRRRV